jgi:uncharacterized membrane protein YhiD involved in acid resistance
LYSSRAAIPCVIGWAREQQERMAGLRTFALDAIASILRGGLYGLQGIANQRGLSRHQRRLRLEHRISA